MFGKQQFVGKMKGSLNDNYTIVKVNFFLQFRNLVRVVMEEYMRSLTKLLTKRELANN